MKKLKNFIEGIQAPKKELMEMESKTVAMVMPLRVFVKELSLVVLVDAIGTAIVALAETIGESDYSIQARRLTVPCQKCFSVKIWMSHEGPHSPHQCCEGQNVLWFSLRLGVGSSLVAASRVLSISSNEREVMKKVAMVDEESVSMGQRASLLRPTSIVYLDIGPH